MALTEQQALERCNYLGGSDIAAVLGMSKYASPLDIYNDKVNPSGYSGETPSTKRGKLLEPIIIELFEEREQVKVTQGLETYRHPKHPFLCANIDGICENAIIEAKSVHIYTHTVKEFGIEGTDHIPNEYLVQCAYYNEVVGTDQVIIPTAFVKDNSGTRESIDGDRLRIYKYERNTTLGENIIKKAVNFWEDHVIKKIPPIGESLRDKNKIKYRFNERAFKVDHPELYDQYLIQVIKKESKNDTRNIG